MDFRTNITKRTRRRKLSCDQIVIQERYVLNYRDPLTGRRRQAFFERKKDAESRQRALLLAVADENYVDKRTAPTVAYATLHWLEDRRANVKASTFGTYRQVTKLITHLCCAAPSGQG